MALLFFTVFEINAVFLNAVELKTQNAKYSGVSISTGGISIEDCIIQNNSSLAGNGGGICGIDTSTVSTAKITISRCQILENSVLLSPNGGGGAYLSILHKPVSIDGCSFVGNTASTASPVSVSFKGGGGLLVDTAIYSGPIKNCIFRDNYLNADIDGAAAYFSTAVTLQNCLFTNNSTESVNFQCSVLNLKKKSAVYNSTFAQNSTLGAKSGRVINLNNLASSVINCLFVGNVSNNTGNIANTNNSIIKNCATDGDAFLGTTASLSNNLTTITATNTFEIPSTFSGAPISLVHKEASAVANWNLKSTSPAINKGLDLSASPTLIITDIVGNTRPQGGVFDIGAYEFQTQTSVDRISASVRFRTTKSGIEFFGLNIADVVTVFDVTGNVVTTKTANDSNLFINLSNGIYLIRVGNITTKVIIP